MLCPKCHAAVCPRWRCKPDIIEDKSNNLSLIFFYLKHIIVSYFEGERMSCRYKQWKWDFFEGQMGSALVIEWGAIWERLRVELYLCHIELSQQRWLLPWCGVLGVSCQNKDPGRLRTCCRDCISCLSPERLGILGLCPVKLREVAGDRSLEKIDGWLIVLWFYLNFYSAGCICKWMCCTLWMIQNVPHYSVAIDSFFRG